MAWWRAARRSVTTAVPRSSATGSPIGDRFPITDRFLRLPARDVKGFPHLTCANADGDDRPLRPGRLRRRPPARDVRAPAAGSSPSTGSRCPTAPATGRCCATPISSHVAREPKTYSASRGGVVLEDLAPETLAMMQDMLLAMDPPRHVGYRRNVAPQFVPRVIGQLEAAHPRDLPGDHARRGRRAVTSTSCTTCAPSSRRRSSASWSASREADWPQIHAWSERNSGGQDPDFSSRLQPTTRRTRRSRWRCTRSSSPQQRRAEPRDDLTTLMLAMELDGEPMTDIQFGSFFVQLVTAGNDTTRTMLSSGLLALLEHPEQLAELRADPALDPRRGRGDPPLGEPAALLPPHRDRDTRARWRGRSPQGQKVGDDLHVGEPGRSGVSRPAPLRHPPRPEPAPVVRHRRALLPRRAPRPARGSRLLRGALRDVPDDRADGAGPAAALEPQQRAEVAPGTTSTT